MSKRLLCVVTVVVVSGLGFPGPIAARDPQAPLPSSQFLLGAAADAHVVRRTLDEARDGADDPAVWDEVERFYAARGYQPAWLAPERRDAAAALVGAMRSAAEEGLSSTYGSGQWERFFREGWASRSRRAAIAAEVHFTGDVTRYVIDLALGSLAESARTIDIAAQLEAAEHGSAAQDVLRRLAPTHREYRDLRRMLQQYRAIEAAGGWPPIPEDILLKHEDDVEGGDEQKDEAPPEPRTARAVRAVCARLAVTQDIRPEQCGSTIEDVYTRELADAVEAFQARHGLLVDGIVGPNTARAMNVPVSARVAQIISNLDRWRHLPDTLGERHVWVNVPAFTLAARENGQAVLTMRVVAGEPETPTPVFSDEITYLEFRPYWNVPRSITTKELLPRIARDPGYLARERFDVVDGWEEPATLVSPDRIDWMAALDSFPFRLRQRPGPANSLGLVKFMFPNQYNVYLHDTPATHRFEARRRAFSHGCVRVEDPVALAAFLLPDADWSPESIQAAMHGTTREVVRLEERVPVHLVYFTAWLDEHGRAQFRDDPYGHDVMTHAGTES